MTQAFDRRIAELAVARGLLPAAEAEGALQEAQRRRAAGEAPPALTEVLLARGIVDAAAAAALLADLARSDQAAGETLVGVVAILGAKPPTAGADATLSATLPTAAGADATLGTTRPIAVAGPVPQLNFGRYEILSELGRGGMGVVYRAHDPQLRREVALKTLPQGAGASPESIERLLREARTAATLDHPGIVRIHEVGAVAGMPFFAMEYVRGRTLREVLQGPDRPGLRERAGWVLQAAEAVAHAHARRIIHRDLKPANLLLGEDGRVHVMDFGLAKEMEERTRLTTTGQILGTPQYMPPEQIDGDAEKLGPASDVYALGAVLYEALTGRAAFEATGVAELLAKVLSRDPVPPRALDPRIPIDLETVCLRTLQKEPERRYPTARELADDLGRFLRGEAVDARRETLVERGFRWVRRRKAITGLIAAAAAASLLAGALGLQSVRDRADRERLQAEKLTVLRSVAALAVDAALFARRAGGRMDQAGQRFVGPLQEAARQVAEQAPGLAEPHFYLGRMYRALLRPADALAEQERGLAKDAGFAPCGYERAVLLAQRYFEQVEAAGDRAREREGGLLSASGRIEAAAAPHRRIDTREVEGGDPQLRSAKAEAIAALDALRGSLARSVAAPDHRRGSPAGSRSWGEHAVPLLRVGGAQLDCVEGMVSAYAPEGWAPARARLEQAIAAAPELEEAHQALAEAAIRFGRYAEAIAALERGLAGDQGNRVLWELAGRARLLQAHALWYRGQDPHAECAAGIAAYGQAVDLAPDRAGARLGRGDVLLARGQFRASRGLDSRADHEAAQADYRRAVELAPDDPQAWMRSGGAWTNLGSWRVSRGEGGEEDYRRAEADYLRALERAPKNAEAWTLLGTVRRSLARVTAARGGDPRAEYARCIEAHDAALACNPAEGRAWLERGLARFELARWLATRGEDPQEMWAAALADLGRAAEELPGSSAPANARGLAHMNRAVYAIQRGGDAAADLDAALAAYGEALGRNPEDFEARLYRGMVHCNRALWRMRSGADPTEDFRRAATDHEEATRLNPTLGEGWGRRSFTLAIWAGHESQSGRDAEALFRSAIECATKAIELNPGSVDVWEARAKSRQNWALARVQRGEDPTEMFAAGEADYVEAVRIHPGKLDAWINRGALLSNWAMHEDTAGRDAETRWRAALAAYDSAIGLNPNSAQAHVCRGQSWLNWAVVRAQKAQDPAEQDERAIADLSRAVALDARSFEARTSRGIAHQNRAGHEGTAGRDPAPDRAAAAADYEASLELNPNQPGLRERIAELRGK